MQGFTLPTLRRRYFWCVPPHNSQAGEENYFNNQCFFTAIITALLVQAPTTHVWIGLNDRAAEATYRWADTTRLEGYTNWGPSQPDNGNNAFQEVPKWTTLITSNLGQFPVQYRSRIHCDPRHKYFKSQGSQTSSRKILRSSQSVTPIRPNG